MNKKWFITPPNENGWYWIKYKGKNGIVVCPAELYFIDKKSKKYILQSAKNDTFFSHTIDESLRFGFPIEFPK